MDASVTVSIITGVGVIISAWFAFAGNKKGSLVEAEQNFRSTILSDNENLRERIEQLEEKLTGVMEENATLKKKVIELEASRKPVDGGKNDEETT